MGVTKTCSPTRKQELFTMPRFTSVRDFSINVTEPIDQMVQAARSGKQNILEGSQASGTSKKFEIKLTNVSPCQS